MATFSTQILIREILAKYIINFSDDIKKKTGVRFGVGFGVHFGMRFGMRYMAKPVPVSVVKKWWCI